MRLFHELHDQGNTIVLITHDEGVALQAERRIAIFDGHVREQLPWYELASAAMGLIARQYIPKNGKVYDLGASTGNVGRVLAHTLEARGDESAV